MTIFLFYLSFIKIFMSVKLVKGYSIVRFFFSLLHCSIFIYLQLHCLPLFTFSTDVSCPSSRLAIFTFFFLDSFHDFHVLYVYVCKREKKDCVCLLSSICTIAFARSYMQCVHIRFIVKKTTKKRRRREEKKDAKKTYIEYLLIFLFLFFFSLPSSSSSSFFFKYSLSSFLIGKKHRNIMI